MSLWNKKEKEKVISKGCVSICCTIGVELNAKRIEQGISSSDALKKGISLEIKEKEWGYDIWEKLRKMSDIISEIAIKHDRMLNKCIRLQTELDEFKQKPEVSA